MYVSPSKAPVVGICELMYSMWNTVEMLEIMFTYIFFKKSEKGENTSLSTHGKTTLLPNYKS